jgi:hypothetical protein
MKNYFVIVNEKTGKMLVHSHLLPIFWVRNIAKEQSDRHPGYIVKTINIKELEKLIKNEKK